MNGTAPVRQEQWLEFIGPRRGNDLPLSREVELPNDLDELSRSELRILRQIWDEFKDIDRFDLVDWVQKFCPEWTDPEGSSIPIELATIFKRLEKAEPIELAEQLQAERRLTMTLSHG